MREEISTVCEHEMRRVSQRQSRLSSAQAAELQRAYRSDGDLAARERLIEAYLPLARSLAHRFADRGEQVEDLVQVGSIGLIKAVDRFEPARGDLAAFAVATIVGEIRRHLRDKGTLIRVPRRQQETTMRLGHARRRLTRRLQRAPTHLELVAAGEITTSELAEAARVSDARSPLALMDDAPALSADDVFHASEDRVAVSTGMRALHRRERQALRCRYYDDMSQTEVAAALGISQTHASRLLASGLAKLRANLDGNSDSSVSSELDSGHGDSRRRPGRAA
jgi:RNA polymerase sigma-B factor